MDIAVIISLLTHVIFVFWLAYHEGKIERLAQLAHDPQDLTNLLDLMNKRIVFLDRRIAEMEERRGSDT